MKAYDLIQTGEAFCLSEFGLLARRDAMRVAASLRSRGLSVYARKAPAHMGQGYLLWEKN